MLFIKTKRNFIVTLALVVTLAVSTVTTTAFAAGMNRRGNGEEPSSQTHERGTQDRTERKPDFDNVNFGEMENGAESTSEKPQKANENNTYETRSKSGEREQHGEEEPSAADSPDEVTAETSESESTYSSDSNNSNTTDSSVQVNYSGDTLFDIANPDSSYSPSYLSLSDYDRAKLERLVMGEAGSMGYEGCALVAQAIRDAMNLSNTSSIDEIIEDYGYYGSTSIEPNEDVKAAVSYIFDENGSAVQHRVLCFYIGSSEWHETQNFIIELDGVRFFDMYI